MTATSLPGRLELKYLIDERTAARVRAQIAPYCQCDPHALRSAAGGRSYAVSSLYLDTPSLAFHRAKERGDAHRFKLRARSYRDGGGFWLEQKVRSQELVRKTRARFHEQSLREAAMGRAKPTDERGDERHGAERFARLVCETGARPTVLVSYQREAFTSIVDHYARVTFDRDIRFQRTKRWTLEGGENAWHDLQDHVASDVPRPLVVMEIKCEFAIPLWLADVVRRNGLRRYSVSKYSLGIYALKRAEGHERLPERGARLLR